MSLHDAQEQYAVGGHQLADRQRHNLFKFFAAIMPTSAFAFAARRPSVECPSRISERDTVVPARQPGEWAALEPCVRLIQHGLRTKRGAARSWCGTAPSRLDNHALRARPRRERDRHANHFLPRLFGKALPGLDNPLDFVRLLVLSACAARALISARIAATGTPVTGWSELTRVGTGAVRSPIGGQTYQLVIG